MYVVQVRDYVYMGSCGRTPKNVSLKLLNTSKLTAGNHFGSDPSSSVCVEALDLAPPEDPPEKPSITVDDTA